MRPMQLIVLGYSDLFHHARKSLIANSHYSPSSILEIRHILDDALSGVVLALEQPIDSLVQCVLYRVEFNPQKRSQQNKYSATIRATFETSADFA